MVRRAWNGLPAILALVALIAAALVSADKLDREQAAGRAAMRLEPAATGSIDGHARHRR